MRSVAPTTFMKFRDCRRRWLFEEIEGLVPKAPQIDLWLGTGIHVGLEAYYKNNRSKDAMLHRFAHWYEKSVSEIQNQLGALWEQSQEEVYQKSQTALGVLERYHEWSASWDVYWTVLETERTYQIPLINYFTKQIPRAAPPVRGRIDLLVEWEHKLWVVDHKFYSSTPSLRMLDFDDQFTGYAYIGRRVFQRPIEGVILNILANKVPKPPTVLKSGKLSQAKDQPTDYQLYLDKIHELGLNESDYTEFLTHLRDNRWVGYFDRQITVRNDEQLKNYEKRLWLGYQDMNACEKNPILAYPNIRFDCERLCPMQKICQGMEDGSDYQYLKQLLCTTRQISDNPRH